MSAPFIGAAVRIPRALPLRREPGKLEGKKECEAVENNFCLGSDEVTTNLILSQE